MSRKMSPSKPTSRQLVAFVLALLVGLLSAGSCAGAHAIRGPRTLRAAAAVWSIAFSPDGKTIAAGGGNYLDTGNTGALQLWNLHSGQLLRTLQRGVGSFACDFSPDGRTLTSVSGPWEGSGSRILLWDTKTGRLEASLSPPRHWTFGCVRFSPDGQTLSASIAKDDMETPARVILWNARTRRRLWSRVGPEAAAGIQSLSFSPDSLWLLGSGSDNDAGVGLLGVWSVRTGKLCDEIESDAGSRALHFLPDGKTLVWGERLISFQRGNLGKVRAIMKPEDDAFVTAVSPAGVLLASVDETTLTTTGPLRLWDVRTGKLKRTLQRSGAAIHSLAFSPDGRILASGSEDGLVKLWRVR